MPDAIARSLLAAFWTFLFVLAAAMNPEGIGSWVAHLHYGYLKAMYQ